MADKLEAARKNAIDLLASLPEGTELWVDDIEDHRASGRAELMLGLGLCIGKGHAVYRGDGHYRITPNGRAYAVEQD